MSYITFQQYIDNGGKTNESTFNYLKVDAESKLDFFTSNRLTNMDEIPTEVIPLLVRIINILSVNDMEGNDNVTAYSNGDESFSFDGSNNMSISDSLDKKLFKLTNQFLERYHLTYRGTENGKNL